MAMLSDDDIGEALIEAMWTCKRCTFDNEGEKRVCDVCGEQRPQVGGAEGSPSWTCPRCTFINREDTHANRCGACGDKRDTRAEYAAADGGCGGAGTGSDDGTPRESSAEADAGSGSGGDTDSDDDGWMQRRRPQPKKKKQKRRTIFSDEDEDSDEGFEQQGAREEGANSTLPAQYVLKQYIVPWHQACA